MALVTEKLREMLSFRHWLAFCMEGLVPQFVTKSSNTILVALVFLSLGVGFTGLRRLTHIRNDLEYLYTPTGSRSSQERKHVEDMFNDTGHFIPRRATRSRHYVNVMIEAKDGRNMLRPHVIREIQRIDKIIRNITIKGNCDYYTFKDLCPLNNGTCNFPEPLRIFELMSEYKEGIPYPVVHMHPEGQHVYDDDLFIGDVIGGVEVSAEGKVKTAKAIILKYYISERTSVLEFDIDPVLHEWERIVHNIQVDSKTVKISTLSSLTFLMALEHARHITPYLVIYSFLMVSAFTTINCLMSNPILSKPYCGVLGTLLPLLGLFTTTGILLHLDVPFIALNLSLPLLLLGIGVDNMFVMLASWRTTDPSIPTYERMEVMYGNAATSVTLTSLTNTIAFAFGLWSPFRSIVYFSLYSGAAMLGIYFFQVFGFGSLIFKMGVAESRGLSAYTFRPSAPDADQMLFFTELFRSKTGAEDVEAEYFPGTNCGMLFFKNVVGTFLCKKSTKIAIFLIYLVYLISSIWGCATLTDGLLVYEIMAQDAKSINFIEKNSDYFRNYFGYVQVVFKGNIHYEDSETRQSLENFTLRLENDPNVDERHTISWLRAIEVPDTDSYEEYGKSIKEKIESETSLRYIQNDVVFDEDFAIKSSRIFILIKDVPSVGDIKETFLRIRKMVDNQNRFSVILFHPNFVFLEMYISVRRSLLSEVGMCSLVVVIVSYVFIPSFISVVGLAFTVFSIQLGVMGYLSFWGVSLNPIVIICMIMCIGFSVDSSVHITYAYISSDLTDSQLRMKHALFEVGLPMFQSCFSSIIALLPLYYSDMYDFTVLFKTMTLVMLFAYIHSVLFLPVFISFGYWLHAKFWVPRFSRPPPPEEPPQPPSEAQNQAPRTSDDFKVIIHRPVRETKLSVKLEPWPKRRPPKSVTIEGPLRRSRDIGTSFEGMGFMSRESKGKLRRNIYDIDSEEID